MGPQPALLQPLRRQDPDRIGAYTLLGRLGAGAMGRVYLGRSAAGRLVAVKTIRLEFAEDADFRHRFAREVAAARRVSGVFTAAVVAADPDANVPWLATAYVPAPSLDRLVQACGPLPVPAVRWLAAGCAEALESIHDAGLVHRDLKPSNVLVSPDGPRVIDFGVARAVERIALTATRGAVGTPAYMAPEQARDTQQATAASDVFSLGSTVVFAATGHAPYQGETVMDVLVRLATEPPDLGGLPSELVRVVTACLERDPRRRPPPAEILEHLAPYVDHADSASGHDYGPAFLPDAALALIDEYRHGTQPPARAADEIAPDATFGSYTSLPEPRHLPRPRWSGGQLSLFHRGAAAAAGLPISSAPGGRRGMRTVASAALVAALVVGGGAVGAWINSSSGQAAPGTSATNSLPPPRPQDGLGSPGLPPPGGIGAPTGKPRLVLNQSHGDGYTTFVVSGRDWAPGARITVRLAGVATASASLFTDRAGAFNYVINQEHEFFAGPIPPDSYRVLVSAPGEPTASQDFNVDP
jgi:serine/threonine protein kinase